MTAQAIVYFVRHGETDANRDKIIQGQLDTPLNGIGLDQAKLVAHALQAVRFDAAFSSDLCRATVTADAILERQPGLELCKRKELRERYMGELQGQVYGNAKRSGIGSTIEAGPSFVQRGLDWWEKDVVQYTASLPLQEEPYNILVVSHGGFLGTLVKTLVQGGRVRPREGVVLAQCPNTSISVIEWDGQVGTLVRYGDVSHLSSGPLEVNADEIRI